MNKRIRKKQLKRNGNYVSSRETWSLDITIAKYILPRLKAFRKDICGEYPCVLNSKEEWYEIIDKMILSFQLITDGAMFDIMYEHERQKVETSINEGLDLFRKYYFNLWRS